MTENQRIAKALEPAGLEVFPDIRQNNPEKYYTYNISTIPADFGDDAPGHERVLVQVHLFLPPDFDGVMLRTQTRKNLFDGGFTWPSMIDASDDESQHWVFECENMQGVQTDGTT